MFNHIQKASRMFDSNLSQAFCHHPEGGVLASAISQHATDAPLRRSCPLFSAQPQGVRLPSEWF